MKINLLPTSFPGPGIKHMTRWSIVFFFNRKTIGQLYKHSTIVNYDSSVVDSLSDLQRLQLIFAKGIFTTRRQVCTYGSICHC